MTREQTAVGKPQAQLSGSQKQQAWALRIRQECLSRYPWGFVETKAEGMRLELLRITSAQFYIRERDALQRGIGREIEDALRRLRNFRESLRKRHAQRRQEAAKVT